MGFQKYLALLKTVELGSISRAAEQMGYTQSAVSRMISDLESEWGVELLHRGRGGIELTSTGQQLLPILQSIVSDKAELDYAVREIHGLHSGLIRVGTFTTVSDMWIPGILSSFRKLYPNITFKLINGESYDEIEEWITQGKVDCGFVSIPTTNDLQVRFLKRDMLSAVLPSNHPLAEVPVISTSQLGGEPFILLKNDEEIRQFVTRLPAPPALCYEVSTDHTILSMVECGLGVSVMHSLIADSNRFQVVWKPFDRSQYRDIGIATLKNPRLSSITKLFVDHVCTQVADMP